jgi:predicted Zn-dependent protease
VLNCGAKREYPVSSKDIEQIGELQRQKIREQYSIHPNNKYAYRLKVIEKKIRRFSYITELNIHYHILLHDIPVAFTTIDNNIYIDAIYLEDDSPYRLNDSELAALISHELAHILKNHLIEEIARFSYNWSLYVEGEYTETPVDWSGVGSMAVQGLTKILFNDYYDNHKKEFDAAAINNKFSSLRNTDSSQEVKSISNSAKEIINVATKSFSLIDEKETDRIALDFLKQAGYEPSSMYSLLEKQISFVRNRGEGYFDEKKRNKYIDNLQSRVDNIKSIIKYM